MSDDTTVNITPRQLTTEQLVEFRAKWLALWKGPGAKGPKIVKNAITRGVIAITEELNRRGGNAECT